jgi:hypothetical protein
MTENMTADDIEDAKYREERIRELNKGSLLIASKDIADMTHGKTPYKETDMPNMSVLSWEEWYDAVHKNAYTAWVEGAMSGFRTARTTDKAYGEMVEKTITSFQLGRMLKE